MNPRTAGRFALLTAAALLIVSCGSSTADEPTTATLSTTVAAPSSAPASSSSSSPAPSKPTTEPTTTEPATPTNTTVTATTRPKPVAKPKPKIRGMLAGGPDTGGPLIAAKIDNTGAAFPQFGVARADIVYIEQVEGGLTRLVALFHSELPDEVGPIRSVRSTDSELLSMYGTPGLAFSGGAGGPLERLAQTPVVDLSANAAGWAYWRSEFGDATHNLHVDIAKLGSEASGIGSPQSPGFTFKAKDSRLAKADKVSTVTAVQQQSTTTFSFATGSYSVRHFDTPYTDQDGTSVVASNVLVQRVTDEPDGTVDTAGAPSYLSHTVGSGEFSLYRDGRVISGTWSRPDAASPTDYLDANGKPVPFKPGRTWVVLATDQSQISAG